MKLKITSKLNDYVQLKDIVYDGLNKFILNSVNRQPSLHEYSIFAMKLRLNDTNAIAYPLAACEPLNADFDGDTVQIQLVPEDAREETIQRMSPRYVNVYKKNNQPIFPFNHETLDLLGAR